MIPEKPAAHIRKDPYGPFQLTDAVRPSADLTVIPRQGYRTEAYRDAKSGARIPVIAASVSRERLFNCFLELLEPLDEVVDVVLETSHECVNSSHADLCREQIDRPVLESCFWDFEDLLTNDGCTGVAVISAGNPMEVQFDEHKLLIVYAHDLAPFRRILERMNIERDDSMKLICEGEHLHTTDWRFVESFAQLSYRLGAGQAAEHVNW